MVKTLIIYDNQGQIYSQITGSFIAPQGGLQYLEVEIPQGKQISSVNTTVTPHKPIIEDIPPSETDLLKKRIEEQELALIELASIIGGA